MDGVAKSVMDPQTNVNVFERKKAYMAINTDNIEQREKILNEKELKLGAMGSGSDYSSFIQHAGIPSLNLGYGGEDNGGEYHSIYDSYYDFTHFKDPGFHYEVALAQTAGLAVLRIANADILPFDFTHLYRTIDGYLNELENLLEQSRKNTVLQNQLIRSEYYTIGKDPQKKLIPPSPQDGVPFLDFSPLQNALQNLKTSADSIQKVFAEKVQTGHTEESFNQSLYRAEQQLLSETGLPRRPWYKHTVYAPGFYTGYGVKTMPGIREAIEQRHWDEAQQQIKISANAIEKLADYLNNLAK